MTPIEEIKRRVEIVDLVGESVALKQSGRNFKAACPFHSERTPSFYVFPDRQTWHCFGACATGGDAFSFVMRRDGVEFGEALRLLARRAGVELPSPQVSKERAGRLDRLRGINQAAAIFFHETLADRPEARAAREHLAKRGLTRETVDEHRLGYSPPEGAALLRRLAAQGYTEQEALAAGLLRKREEDGGLYHFFRNRLMIPIQDARGDYLGFGARALDDSQPKYLNSPQSDLFDKSAILYGIHQAAEAIRNERTAVIVEGYMDALMAHQCGFRNVVASMGTALTERQVGALKRLGHTFVLALDPDAAGDEATLRSLESAWRVLDRPPPRQSQAARLTGGEPQEIVLKVMDLPRGKDPDEVIREDPERWRALAASAIPVIDYVFGAMARRIDTSNGKGKAALARRLAPFIHNAPNVFERNERIKKLAHLLGEDENIVWQAVGGLGRARGGRSTPSAAHTPPDLTPPARDPVEAYCIAMLLRYPELLPAASALNPDHLASTPLRAIYEALRGGAPVDALGSELQEEVQALRLFPIPPADARQREEGLRKSLRRLEDRRLRLHLVAMHDMAEAAEQVEEVRARLARLHAEG